MYNVFAKVRKYSLFSISNYMLWFTIEHVFFSFSVFISCVD